MPFSLIEPVAPRYIHINPVTNIIHIMVPVVGGEEISTDNTCKAKLASKEFFDGKAFDELNRYKSALELDIELLKEEAAERRHKEDRLLQIHSYIEAVNAMRWAYAPAIEKELSEPSNLYSIQLRPRLQDPVSVVINPTFTVNREPPLSSALYDELHDTLSTTTIAPLNPRTRLITATLTALSPAPTAPLSLGSSTESSSYARKRRREETSLTTAPGAKRSRYSEPETTSHLSLESIFTALQRILKEQCQHLFDLDINFTRDEKNELVDKTYVDTLMGFSPESPATTEDYIEALLGFCANELWENITTPPFYALHPKMPNKERTESLSMLTQFFLAIVNVHCKAKGISTQNFGATLDNSASLSKELVTMISEALHAGTSVEEEICAFFNKKSSAFNLTRALSAEDIKTIKEKFARTYRTVTATKENPHMDDFMILDKDVSDKEAKFVIHQGAICVNFATLITPTVAAANSSYFARVLEDFTTHSIDIPHKNESIARSVDITIETLLNRLNQKQLEMMPKEVQETCYTHPLFQVRTFLQYIAQGQQEEAAAFLSANTANIQRLLCTSGICTDYSGRTFHCSAYEYAYWAKDTHMCRMLETYMDEETKAHTLACINTMERIDEATGQPTGLVYQQQDKTHRSAHFDFTPLTNALQYYSDNYNHWRERNEWTLIRNAWLDVGKAQRDVPAHIAQEYCRPERSFDPKPSFNEATLPRVLSIQCFEPSDSNSWFPLVSSHYELGSHFALLKGTRTGVPARESYPLNLRNVNLDRTAMMHLDEVRTSELIQARERLIPVVPSMVFV